MRAMELINNFNYTTGYSDHSPDSTAAKLSLAFGGKIIEKHFTTDKSLPGPDQKASSNPEEFAKLVNDIRQTEIILGKKQKKLQKEEKSMHKISRKSFFTKQDIIKNEKLTLSKLKLLRPGTGISYKNIKYFLEKKVKKNIKKNTLLTRKLLKNYVK
tara:strand:- start:23 stop:493 length:471 start_codon:yes stop_codon:yes gene_type:complete